MRGITPNHNNKYYCINCLHSFRTEHKLKSQKDAFKNLDYCYIEMPEKDKDILKYSQVNKSVKDPFVIYADIESLYETNRYIPYYPEYSSTLKTEKYTVCGYSFSTHCLFDDNKSQLDYYRGK